MEPKQQPPYPLRMPPDMRAFLEGVAANEGRSLNAEILRRLQQSLDSPDNDGESARLQEELQTYKLMASGNEVTAMALCRYILAMADEMPAEVKASSRVVDLAEPFARSFLARDAGLPMAYVRLLGLAENPDALQVAEELKEHVMRNPPPPRQAAPASDTTPESEHAKRARQRRALKAVATESVQTLLGQPKARK